MSDPLAAELNTILRRLRRDHDVLPFLDRMLAVRDVQLALLPDDMMALLASSSDFRSIRPGEPVWIAVSAPPDASAELVIYRAEADARHYVIAPVAL